MGRKILADAGYEVVTVNNGSAALKKIAETKPDLIVLDVYMPGYSGLEVCQRLKEAQETARIPVMLTVGKLEPFKPEEAKRVRAEGFIVKPFEASELLAALAKLEDKIVPRAEPSKPGRFARANAAIDEGRYDKTVAVDEDSGWKNRIAFPSKKKKAVENEDGDDPAIYNAVNKDLRTTIEHKPAPVAHPQGEEERVDLGALAPEGLPKDVTPEEIAALAAAAAQVKGKLAEPAAESRSQSGPAESPEGQATKIKAVEPQNIEAKAEEKPLAKEEVPVEAPKNAAPEAATFAEQKSGAQGEELADKISDIPREAPTPEPSPADMMAAIAALEIGSGNGSGSPFSSQMPADVPVTMAVAAGAEYLSAPSRWTAVSVSLSADEASTSLEHEMQKAHAAFAAAESAHAAPATSAVEPPAAADQSAPTETISPVEAVTPELVGPVQTNSEPEPQQTETHLPSMSSTATSTAGAISSAVKVFETVAASFFKSHSPASTEPVQAAEPVAADTAMAPAVEAKIEEPSFCQPTVAEPEPEKAELPTAEEFKQDSFGASNEVPKAEPIEAQKKEEQNEEQKYERREEGQSEEPHREEPAPVVPVSSTAIEVAQEDPAKTEAQPGDRHESHAPVAKETAYQASSEIPSEVTPPAPRGEHAARGTEGVGTKESEIAETTAAAWASWRRIRESSDSRHTPAQSEKPQEGQEVEPASRDEAAMAVAAGAEKAPEEASTAPEESGEIANIVDSVLAEMRPKIVAEISKKMGKKK
jgi:CheY-like chemotaxis protein